MMLCKIERILQDTQEDLSLLIFFLGEVIPFKLSFPT